MRKPIALIIDDEPDIRELLEITLQRMNIDTCAAGCLGDAMQQLATHRFDLCLADMRLPDGNGIDFIRHMAVHQPDTPVAMITAHGNMDTAIEALKAGAFDFVSKPVDLPVLRRLVETALRLTPGTTSKPSDQPGRINLLGKSAPLEAIRRMISKLARSQAPVFVSGESGTGKELASRLIHHSSPRKDQPFVAVNCGAIPGELMESELFGHLKGSFTGAVRDKQGLFQAAEGGTLFLDEVADLPLSMQVKLLRVIQEKRIRPVGSAEEISIDVRLISASHKNMPEMVANGDFRQDLFYRIHVIELNMPPLRERREDIGVMVDFILTRISGACDMPKPRIDRDALKALHEHTYPGNVRELENILERACALCEEGMIQASDLGLGTSYHRPDDSPQLQGDLEAYLAGIERKAILRTLNKYTWNRTATAKQLGLTLRSLRYRMEKLGLEQEDPAVRPE